MILRLSMERLKFRNEVRNLIEFNVIRFLVAALTRNDKSIFYQG